MNDVEFLRQFLAIPSPSGEEGAVAEFLVRQMNRLGFATQCDEAGNVVGALGAADGSAERTIVLLGHMDTVPGLIAVRQEGDQLYGRGAVDAKGPLAAFIWAAARLAPQLEGTRLLVIGAVEEEVHGRGAHHLAETMAAPDCCIVGEPGGWDGITIGYKGMMTVEYRQVQPSKHRASGWPTPGREKAVDFWNCLTAYAEKLNGDSSWRFDTFDADLRAVHTFGDGLQEGTEMTIGLRLPPGFEVATLQQQMRTWCNGSGAQVTFPYGEPPFQAEKNNPLVRQLLRAIRAHGGQPRFKLKTGTSDMNVVGPVWGCPIVTYGPGDAAYDHTPDEHLQLGEWRRGVEVLVEAVRGLAATPRRTPAKETLSHAPA